MEFEFLHGEDVRVLGLKINQVIPEGTLNRVTLGALGGLAAILLADLVVEEGEEALMELLRMWTWEIASKAIMIGKLHAENFDFEAWAAGQLPTAGEA